MTQLLQILGAVLILVPFAFQQLGSLSPGSPTYLWPNVLGSGVLAATAISAGQWGFVLLEGCWAAVSVRSLITSGGGAQRE